MADRDLRVRILMDAADRVSRPLRDIMGGAGRATDALRDTRQALQRINDQQGQLNAFRTLRAGMARSEQAMKEAQQRAAALGREMAQTANPTRAMARAFEQAKRDAAQLTQQHRSQTQQLQDLRRRLRETGIDTRDLARHERELRDRARDTTRAMEEQARELERITRRQQRFGQARDQFNSRMGTAQNAAGAGMGMLMTAGAMALPIVAGVKAAQDYESVMTDIGQKANLTRAATAMMGADLLRAARAANQMPDAMQGGVDTLAGFGLTPQEATKMMLPIGRAATAYKAEIADLAAAGFAAHDNLKIPIDQTERMIDGMAAAGKAGAFEIKDMATYFPSLTAAYQGMGQKGVAAGVDLAAALQITRKGAGDSATAAGNLQNVLQKISSPATVRAFAKMGVDLPKSLQRMYKEGKTPIEAIAELTNSTLKGDLSRMGYLFEDAQVQGGLRPLIQNLEEFRRIRAEAGKASGTTDRDFAERMRDSAEATKQVKVNAMTLGIQLGTVLLPAVNDLLGKAASMASGLGDWAQRHPTLTKAMVMMTVAVIALTAAAAIMTLGYAAAMGPMAIFGALSTATGIAMLPLIGIVAGVVAAIALLAVGAYLIYKNWDGIVAWFGNLWTGIKAFFSSGIGNISATIANWSPIGLFYSAFASVMNYFGVSMPAKFTDFGRNLISGLIRGVTSMLGALRSTIVNAASSAANWFKSKLGIRSPSRVFAGFGGFMMQGLEGGIDRGAGGPLDRITRLSRDLSGAMVLGAATPALASGLPPPGSPGGVTSGGAGPRTYNITVNAGAGSPADIEAAVRRAIESVERENAARRRSQFADAPDWNV